MINPASGFWPIFGPLGPTAGPGSLRTGSGSKKQRRLRQKSAPEINDLARSWVLCVFGAGRKKIRAPGTPIKSAR